MPPTASATGGRLSSAAPAAPTGPPAEVVQFLEASSELYPMWHYSDAAKLMAVTDHTQARARAQR